MTAGSSLFPPSEVSASSPISFKKPAIVVESSAFGKTLETRRTMLSLLMTKVALVGRLPRAARAENDGKKHNSNGSRTSSPTTVGSLPRAAQAEKKFSQAVVVFGLQKNRQQQQPKSYQAVKAATAVTLGGSMLVLSGLTLAGTVVGLTLVTPLLVIFCPVLVPAAIAVCLIGAGFLSSGGFEVATLSVLSWIYKYVTGKHPVGADQLDQAQMTLASKANEIREQSEHHGQQMTTT